MQENTNQEINQIIERNLFREPVYNIVEQGSTRILDFGCNEGELLLRLQRDKGCSELYGVEINEKCKNVLERHLTKSWIMDLGEEENELGSEFEGFFNYIVLHDVIEHLYDPWYVLAKLRKYISSSGKLIIVTPNPQYWQIYYLLGQGWFPYGVGGGLMNEEHIRWFPYNSLLELVSLTGFKAEYTNLMFPPEVDPSELSSDKKHKSLKLPVAETGFKEDIEMEIKFKEGSEHIFQLFLANKFMVVCSPEEYAPKPRKIFFEQLAKLRDELDENNKKQSC